MAGMADDLIGRNLSLVVVGPHDTVGVGFDLAIAVGFGASVSVLVAVGSPVPTTGFAFRTVLAKLNMVLNR